ncbi:hypothetical protein GE09DRAFT_1085685 [Coniochaeta sp. 2T2.1]|nr:hypothetical protein GE09DRAFT_1085647 [Coniochaeta sp. 2T2.1]KAB5581259.1 hypothetical protein GE09DRAFT_1085685 [Coniochaeta sp. 2T2.1]
MSSNSVARPAWQVGGQRIVTNIISIQKNQDAMDKTFELLVRFLEQVRENEPGCQLFLVNRDDVNFQFVTYEMYKDAECVKHHLQTDYIKELLKAEDDNNLKRAENDIHREMLVAQIGPRNMD